MVDLTLVDRNTALLERFWTSWRASDREAMATVFTPDAVWNPPLFATRLEGHHARVGPEAIIVMLTGAASGIYDKATLKIERMFLAAGEANGVIQFTVDGKTVTGRDYNNLYVKTFRFEGGLIAEAWEHMDALVWQRSVRPEG